jgi:hypothetical protein
VYHGQRSSRRPHRATRAVHARSRPSSAAKTTRFQRSGRVVGAKCPSHPQVEHPGQGEFDADQAAVVAWRRRRVGVHLQVARELADGNCGIAGETMPRRSEREQIIASISVQQSVSGRRPSSQAAGSRATVR